MLSVGRKVRWVCHVIMFSIIYLTISNLKLIIIQSKSHEIYQVICLIANVEPPIWEEFEYKVPDEHRG